jgi:exopolysaccharide biosynthesis polyprenyl glycosylphosphotransferase
MGTYSPKRSLDRIRTDLVKAGIDVLAVGLAFAISFLAHRAFVDQGLRVEDVPYWGPFALTAVGFAALLVSVFAVLGLYRPDTSWLNIRELERAVRGSFIAGAIFLSLLFLSEQSPLSRTGVGLSVLGAMVSVVLVRRLSREAFGPLQRPEGVARLVLIYGAGEPGRLLMKKIVRSVHTDRLVVGFLEDEAPTGNVVSCRLGPESGLAFEAPVLGRFGDLAEVVRDHEIDEVLITTPMEDTDRLRDVTRLCRDRGIAVGLVPRFGPFRMDQLATQEIGAVPVLRPLVGRPKRLYEVTKRAMDLAVGGLLLVVTAPLWVVAAVLIRTDSPGPVFFRQNRVSDKGIFEMIKFRTMRMDADPYATSPASSSDARLTRVGRFIRRAGLDELPQLLNVLRGEMSLVGPRPEMPYIVEGYSELEELRLTVPPGITGLWQLSADRGVHIHENIEYDLYYVYNRSLTLDLIILFESAMFVLAALWPVKKRAPRKRRPSVSPVEPAESAPCSSVAAGAPKEVTRGAPGPGRTVPSGSATGRGSDGERGYLLVALDQRKNRRRAHWRKALPTAYRVSSEWSVKLLVAEENRAEMDRLLDEAVRRWGTDGFRVEFTRFAGGERLRGLMTRSGAVLTDLPHVIQWAEEAGVEVVALEGIVVQSNRAERHGSPLARQVVELLSAPAGPGLVRTTPRTRWTR